MKKILISACLVGERVRYDGRDATLQNKIVDRWLSEGRVLKLCPEVVDGRGVPRSPAEIIGANGFAVLDGFAAVVDKEGNDVTREMMEGARNVLSQAQSQGVKVAVLKDGSPSCGRSYIYNGQFRGIRKRGESGVTAALLQRNGIAVFSEHQIEQADQRLRELDNRKIRGKNISR